MNSKTPILIVGTTCDYVDWLRRARPGQCLFITDPELRRRATEPQPETWEELCIPLNDHATVRNALLEHIKRHQLSLGGIACFDCEAMLLTAHLATHCKLPYQTPKAIRACRSKYEATTHWNRAGLPAPQSRIVNTLSQSLAFQKSLGNTCVMKPVSGCGSELTFICKNSADINQAFEQLTTGLACRQTSSMYAPRAGGNSEILIEEWIEGIEYSCDVYLSDTQAHIIRLCRKHPSTSGPFGTTEAYELLPTQLWPLPQDRLQTLLFRAATAVNLTPTIFMIDMIIRNGEPVLLEIAPRPGGDCLPWLLRSTQGLDILTLTLDLAAIHAGNPLAERLCETAAVGLRLFAGQAGTIRSFNTQALQCDPRVRNIHLRHQAGHTVVLPPDDYDSRLLGHVIYMPDPQLPIAAQNNHLTSLLTLEWT